MYSFPLIYLPTMNFLTIIRFSLGLFLSLRQGFYVFQPWLSWNYLCRAGWSQTRRDLPTSASPVLRLKVCATTS